MDNKKKETIPSQANEQGEKVSKDGEHEILSDFFKNKKQEVHVENVEDRKVEHAEDKKGEKLKDKGGKGSDLSGKAIYGATVIAGHIASANEDDNVGVKSIVTAVDGISKSKDVTEVVKQAIQGIKQKNINKKQSLSVEKPADINIDELEGAEKNKVKGDVKKGKKLKKDIRKGKYDSNKLAKIINKKGTISVDDDLKNAKLSKGKNNTFVVNKIVNKTISQIKKANVDDNVGIEGAIVSVEAAVKGKRVAATGARVISGTAARAKGLIQYLKSFKGLGAKGGISKFGKDAVKIVKNISKAAIQTTLKSAAGFIAPLLVLILLVVLLSNVLTASVPVLTELLSIYPAEAEELTASSSEIGGLADGLYQEIETIEEQPQWAHINEFNFAPEKTVMQVEIFDYDMYVIMGYLSAKYQDFVISDVQDEIQAIYNEMFVIVYDEVIEQRTRPDGLGGTETYDYYILNVSLNKKTSEEVVLPKLGSQEEKDLYNTYTDEALAGGQQLILNPFRSDWRSNISSRYGTRSYQMHGADVTDFHTGLDLQYPAGTPLYGGVTGTVTAVTYGSTGYGYHIRMKTKEGNVEVLYAHMSAIYVAVGDTITAGVTPVGLVGTTGWSSGPHLHIEISLNGERQDPIYFLGYATR